MASTQPKTGYQPFIVGKDSERYRLRVYVRLPEDGSPIDEPLLNKLKNRGGDVVSDANGYILEIPNGVNRWVDTLLVATVFGARAENRGYWQLELKLISRCVVIILILNESIPSDFRSAVRSILKTLKKTTDIPDEVSEDIDKLLANFKEKSKGIAEITNSLNGIHWDDTDNEHVRCDIWAELMLLDAELHFSPKTGEDRRCEIENEIKRSRALASHYKPIVKCLIDEYRWTALEPLKKEIDKMFPNSDSEEEEEQVGLTGNSVHLWCPTDL